VVVCVVVVVLAEVVEVVVAEVVEGVVLEVEGDVAEVVVVDEDSPEDIFVFAVEYVVISDVELNVEVVKARADKLNFML